jgi:osmotically-inducible protein OsmY
MLVRRDLERIAEARLAASSHPGLRRIRCRSDGEKLILAGRLSTFFQKQMAQEIIAQIDGVDEIVNQIEVDNRLTGWPELKRT